jgi:hypothetical protein
MSRPADAVKQLIGACGADGIDDATIAGAVERNSTFMTLPLDGRDVASGGTFKRLFWRARWGDWQDGAEVFDYNGTALAIDYADLAAGEWMLLAEPKGTPFVQGRTVDIYAAAADCLDQLAASNAGELQAFAGQGGSFSYAPKSMGFVAMAREYRKQSRIIGHQAERIDAISAAYYNR